MPQYREPAASYEEKALIQPAAEKGLYYVTSPEQAGCQTWQVGQRYELLKVLGEGSFSCVCLALDKSTGAHVAVKRVGDVLASTENAKRVLRECAILRRLNHPNIVRLEGLFMHPSSTGRLVFRGGRLIPLSMDLYMVLEYCDQGDLFHMRGQMSEMDVQFVMWQLLDALKYIHACDVWHRDIKSANLLIHVQDGRRIAKLCDFGSARSARAKSGDAPNGHWTSPTQGGLPGLGTAGGVNVNTSVEMDKVASARGVNGDGDASLTTNVPRQSSFTMDSWPSMQMLNQANGSRGSGRLTKADISQGGRVSSGMPSMADLYARPSGNKRGGFLQPLTRAVCTPCYRAPEVVMSHGQYSCALDMWSLGCVFGELLQRVPYVGKSATPHLQVAPVISVTGDPVTPKEGERFEGPGNATTCMELAALFAVVGTPAWGTIDAVVKHPAWHAYMQKVPGRPSQLHNRFSSAGDAAVDLLSRLLEFDPSRRASAAEACEHAYFDSLRRELEMCRLEEEEEEEYWHQQDQLQHQAQQATSPVRGEDHTNHNSRPAPISLAHQQTYPPGLEPSLPSPHQLLALPSSCSQATSPRQGPPTPQWAHAQSGPLAFSGSCGGAAPPNTRCSSAGFSAGPGQGLGVLSSGVAAGPQSPTMHGLLSKGPGASPFLPVAGTMVDVCRDEDMRAKGQGRLSGAEADLELSTTSQVLADIEQELSQIGEMGGSEGNQRLREMLEKECEEHARMLYEREMQAAARAIGRHPSTSQRLGCSSEPASDMDAVTPGVALSGSGGVGGALAAAAAAGGGASFVEGLDVSDGGVWHGDVHGGSGTMTMGVGGGSTVQRRSAVARSRVMRRLGGTRLEGLKPDPANTQDPSQIGQERMSHHRDAEQAGLLPEQHLREGRHGEWVPTSLVDAMARTGHHTSWGVSLAPPGMEEGQMDPGMMEAIRAQHASQQPMACCVARSLSCNASPMAFTRAVAPVPYVSMSWRVDVLRHG